MKIQSYAIWLLTIFAACNCASAADQTINVKNAYDYFQSGGYAYTPNAPYLAFIKDKTVIQVFAKAKKIQER